MDIEKIEDSNSELYTNETNAQVDLHTKHLCIKYVEM